jgi:hypothetical protein
MYATKLAIATLGRRVLALEADGRRLDRELETLVRRCAPSLLEVYGVGINTAAILLVATGDNPHRLKSEAAFAHLCGVAPLDASSGKTIRHRLNPGGNRQANHALWRIVFTGMSSDERTRKYVARRVAEGKTATRAAHHQQRADRLDITIGRLRDPRRTARQRGACRFDRVELVGLAIAAPLLTVGTVDLDHHQPPTPQMTSQPGTVRAGAFHSDPIHDTEARKPAGQLDIARRSRRERFDA